MGQPQGPWKEVDCDLVEYQVLPINWNFKDNATVVGDVVMGDECSVWFQAVVRGDVHYIRMGHKVNIQDGAIK